MIDVLVALAAFGGLGLAATIGLRQRALREALQDAQRRLYVAQARLNELESGVHKDLQTLRTAIRRQSGGSIFEPTMRIADAVTIDPRVREVLAQFHLGGCSSCAINEADTIQQTATSYGINVEHLMAALEALENGSASTPPSPPRARLLQLGEF
jgi:hybrid cluster-associated redox disulfide protein